MAGKFYAVKKGRKPGIYMSWDACKAQVMGFPNARYKGFKTKAEAEAFLNPDANELMQIDENTLVVVDGAYQEYASFKDEKKRICPKDLIEKFPNTVYLGTFSKAYALGGMRVGYGLAKEEIISTFYKIRAPFNITTLSLAAAIEALKDEEFVKDCIEKNFIEMKRYEKYCQDNGFEYIPSYTNFITILLKNFISKTVAQKLLEKGMIVRDLTGYGLNAIRITIGTNEQNTKLFKLLDEVLEELK